MTQPHHECAHSRRDFLTRAGGGMGLLALMALLEQDGRADEPGRPAGRQAAALQGDREKRHLVLPRRRPQPHRPVRPQAGTEQAGRQAAAAVVQAAGDGDGPHLRHAAAGVQAQLQTVRRVGPVGQRLVSRDRHLRRRPGRAEGLLRRRTQPRRQHLPDEHRRRPRRPAVPRLVDALRPRQRQPGIARLRRAARQPGGPARRQPQLGHRLHAGPLPGRPLPRRQDAHFVSRSAAERGRRPGAGQARLHPGAEPPPPGRARRRRRAGSAHRVL